MKYKLILLIVLQLFIFNLKINPQTPDTTPPDIYSEILPGMKEKNKKINANIQNTPSNTELEKEKNNTEQVQQAQNEGKKTFSIKEILENKTFMNIIILIIIFTIFFIYRLRK